MSKKSRTGPQQLPLFDVPRARVLTHPEVIKLLLGMFSNPAHYEWYTEKYIRLELCHDAGALRAVTADDGTLMGYIVVDEEALRAWTTAKCLGEKDWPSKASGRVTLDTGWVPPPLAPRRKY